MAKVERVREVLSSPPTAEYWRQKADEGWRPVAVEWERKTEGAGGNGRLKEEVPYGLQVSDDCLYLEENPSEIEAMRQMLEQIVSDRPLSAAAEELNRRGFRQRGGSRWTQVAVFNMLPRLIEVAPRIYSSEEWNERRHRLQQVAG
jgi:Recombinase